MRRRIRYAFVFTALAASCVYWGVQTPWWAAVPLFMVAVAFITVGLAFAAAWPSLFMKRSTGTMYPAAWLMLWPYLLLNHVLLRLIAITSDEDAVNHIEANVYLGRRLSMRDYPAAFPDGVAGTVDLTAEFGEIRPLRDGPYLLLPTIDTLEPSVPQVIRAIRFIDEHRKQGPVFIHCAMGHGRSATVVAAWLVFTMKIKPEQAVEHIKQHRPAIDLHPEQMAVVQDFIESEKNLETPYG